MSFDKLVWAKTCLGYAGWLQNTLRIDRNMFWDHLILANIRISIFDLQISTLGTTIRPQNLPFRPGISQETFWFLRIDYRLSIIDYWLLIIDYRSSIIDYRLLIIDYRLTFLNIRRCVFRQSLRRVKFSKKKNTFFWFFLQKTKTAKTEFVCDFVYP